MTAEIDTLVIMMRPWMSYATALEHVHACASNKRNACDYLVFAAPALAVSAVVSCSLDFLVALQAFLTVVGNCTCWFAAYRIYTAAQEEKAA